MFWNLCLRKKIRENFEELEILTRKFVEFFLKGWVFRLEVLEKAQKSQIQTIFRPSWHISFYNEDENGLSFEFFETDSV